MEIFFYNLFDYIKVKLNTTIRSYNEYVFRK